MNDVHYLSLKSFAVYKAKGSTFRSYNNINSVTVPH